MEYARDTGDTVAARKFSAAADDFSETLAGRVVSPQVAGEGDEAIPARDLGGGTVDDQDLMRRIEAGDDHAFRLLAERHAGAIMVLAERMLGRGADADDVAQEALVRIWRHAGRWRAERARLGTWIHAIVSRLCIDRLRRKQPLPLEAAADIADPAASALDHVAANQCHGRLRRAMAALPPRQRLALTLFYYQDHDGAEAAQIMALSQRAFWSLLHRARQNVQQAMDRDHAGPTGDGQ